MALTHVLIHGVRVDEVGQQVAAPQEENFAQHVGNQAAAEGRRSLACVGGWGGNISLKPIKRWLQ